MCGELQTKYSLSTAPTNSSVVIDDGLLSVDPSESGSIGTYAFNLTVWPKDYPTNRHSLNFHIAVVEHCSDGTEVTVGDAKFVDKDGNLVNESILV